MTTGGVIRKLTAVLHADVRGYSRLMAADEVSTVRTLAAYKEVLLKLVQLHRGRVVDTAGDGFLVEFASVVDAVGCAVEFQREIKTRNAKLVDDRKMEFRIGINIGDVIQEGEQIFGDGVNIAARLEGLADPGGICISGTAYDQLKKKLPLDYEYLGERSVKNIEEPVRAYRVRLEPEGTAVERTEDKRIRTRRWRTIAATTTIGVLLAVAAVGVGYFYRHTSLPGAKLATDQGPALELPDVPSIAVLPFLNTSGDTAQEYFSDGITEEVSGSLSKFPKLFVIAPDSAFAFKRQGMTLQEVSRKLGVRYVVEGSACKDGDRVQMGAKLIDAQTGLQLWADQYERRWEDIFALEDEITRGIITALDVRPAADEWPRKKSQHPPATNLAAYEKVLQGLSYTRQHTEDSNAMARQSFEQALALDPECATAYAALARMQLLEITRERARSPREPWEKAAQFAHKAVALDNSLDTAHIVIGQIYLRKRQYDNAVASCEKAVMLNPNGADAYAFLGQMKMYAGKSEEAVAELNKAIRLNPIAPIWYFVTLGNAHIGMYQHGQALQVFKKGLDRQGDNAGILIGLAAAYALAGQQDEARVAAASLARVHPGFSLENAAKRLLYKNPADTARIIGALRKAGLK
ncbi:MAG: adenylate/guanylate cyclase domain-containing protein [Thermodesulfobacteriota bacterium]